MEFSSLYFLYLFLPLTLLVYFLVPGLRLKNIVLLAASLLFYAMGQPVYVLLLVGLSYANFAMARCIRPGKRNTLLLPVVVNLAVLGLFKYLDFFLGIFGITVADGGVMLAALRGITNGLNSIGFAFRSPTSALPLGLSFYAFQVISYVADVYRGKVKAERSFFNLLLYLSMFPKMMQGPIVRYEQVARQLMDRRTTPRAAFEGAQRFIIGLAKKVLLADYAGKVVESLSTGGGNGTFVGAWLAALMFMFQIYFDFSGYSDMAIGLGRIFGFRYCENFDLPYISTSITEFWRRWHMSLGSFFRDYVYIPLGGNRRGKARQILNLLAVWALTGLWHGASWNFVLWGLYFFVLLSIEKQIAPKLETLPFIVRNLVTMFFVLIGWVLFMNTSLSGIGSAFAAMFGGGTSFAGSGVSLQLKNSLPLLLTCLIGSSVLPRWFGFIWSGLFGMGRSDRRGAVTVKKGIYLASVFLFLILLLWLCTVSLVGSTSSPSMYAQF